MIKNFGFVVLCPQLNKGGLRSTVSAIRSIFGQIPYTIVVPGTIAKKEFREFSKYGQISCGCNNIASLINTGVHESHSEWNFLITAGAIPYYGLLKKYSYFLKDEKDILYAVFSRPRWRFEESSLNGLLISKKAMKEIGDFPENENNIEICKMDWCDRANKLGYCIKGLVGAKIC